MEDNPQHQPRKKLLYDLFQKDDSSLGDFETQKKGISEEEIEKETELLWSRIKSEGETNPFRIRFLKRRHFLYAAAASVVLCIAAFMAFLQLNTASSVTFQTAYGEMQTITLPDGSEVVLNANSQLTYPENWDPQAVREVWLEGEAFFQVQEKPAEGGIKFIVHTQGLDVEVLGTRFNVRNRRDATEVVLNSGKVKLNFGGKETLLMEPGDWVEYSLKTHDYDHRQINTETYTSWRNNVLIFEENTLEEIATVLEDTHGFDFSFKNPEIAGKRFTTTLPANQIEILFPMLEESFNLKITQNGKQITVENAR